MKRKRINILLVTVMSLVALFGITVGTVSAVGTDEFDVVLQAAIANNGAVPALGLTSDVALNTLLTDADPSNDPLIVDLRTADEYANGHIIGSINVHYRTLGDAAVISGLNAALAAHIANGGANSIVSYGNEHHFKVFAQYLYIQGLPAKSLSHGLAGWTKNTVAAPNRYKRCTTFDALGHGIAPAGCNTNDFPVTAPYDYANYDDAALRSGEGYPNVDCISGPVTAADLPEITRCTFSAMYGNPANPEYQITAATVYDMLDDNQDGCMACAGDDLSNDPFVLSNRGSLWNMPTCTKPGPDLERGHIPGVVSVDWCFGPSRMELKTLQNTDFMPVNDLVVHHCWVGQSQMYGAAWYHLLGYTAISMDWGINSWTDDDYVRQAVINEIQYVSDLVVEAYADVKVMPTTLNTRSKGDYVTAVIKLPAGYDNTIIDISTVKLNGTLSAVSGSSTVDSVTVKFNRAAVGGIVSPGANTMTVTGSSTDGKLIFVGSSIMNVQ